MLPKLLLTLLSSALLCLPGAVSAAPAGGSAQSAENLVRAGESEGLTGQLVFQLLLGEVALQRGDMGLALSAYQDLALRTRDPAIVQRAVELAGAAQQYGIALQMTRLWLELEPESTPARQMLAGLLVMAGRINELDGPVSAMLAEESDAIGPNLMGLNRLLARYPDKVAALAFVERMTAPYAQMPEAHYAMAVAAAAAGQHDRAAAEARQVRSLKPDWEAGVMLQVQLIIREPGPQQLAEAADVLKDYLRDHPDAQDIRLHLARVLIGAKNYPQAREQFEKLLRQSPNNPDIVYPVAMLALQEKDLEMARKQFSHLLELPFPDRGAVHYFLGQLEEESGNGEAALAQYRQVAGGAQYMMARNRGARLLATQGKLDEGLAFLRESEARAPKEKSQLAQMEAQLLREAGRYEAVYGVLDTALKQQPNDTDLMYDTALAAERVGKVQEMEVLLKKLIKAQPENAHAFNALGYSLADRNLRLKEAHELIARATALAPADPFIMDSMGWVLYRQGKLGEARAVLEKAFGIKADPEIAAHLGEVLWKLGQQDQARALWQKAAETASGNDTLQSTMKRFLP